MENDGTIPTSPIMSPGTQSPQPIVPPVTSPPAANVSQPSGITNNPPVVAKKSNRSGCLIIFFVLVGLCAVLIPVVGIGAAVVLTAVNPGKQFASARDTQRRADLYGITNAIAEYSKEHGGTVPSSIPTSPTALGTGEGNVNVAPLLVPTYLMAIPKDPSTGTDANTQYTIYRTSDGRLHVKAASELHPSSYIEVIR